MISKALVVFLALCALPLVAAPPMTTITVKVTSLTGKPVDRASVIVKFISGHAKLKLGKSILTQYQLQTTQEGEAKIPPIPQGKIQIQVIAKNYQTFGDVFDITETEKTVEIKMNPPQSQYSVHE
ncbi:MAG: carboxypeptidase-like regulatory domain-containing protein [Bryobacteraceae bacterium]|jgi:hypothetical protein